MNGIVRTLGSWLLPIFTLAVYLFLYVPMVVLVVFSFNDSTLPQRWVGFTTSWYQELFTSYELLFALQNSVIVALCSVMLSLLIGITFVYYGTRARLMKLLPSFYAGLALPEIILAVGLLNVLIFFGVPQGLMALIAGHTLIGLVFVVPILYTRFVDLDPVLTEAAFDLGASENQIFFQIIVPLMTPALVSAGLLVFILSFDDFLIAFFCASSSAQTLPLYIFAQIRSGVSPVVNALSSCILLVSSMFVLAFTLINRGNREEYQ